MAGAEVAESRTEARCSPTSSGLNEGLASELQLHFGSSAATVASRLTDVTVAAASSNPLLSAIAASAAG